MTHCFLAFFFWTPFFTHTFCFSFNQAGSDLSANVTCAHLHMSVADVKMVTGVHMNTFNELSWCWTGGVNTSSSSSLFCFYGLLIYCRVWSELNISSSKALLNPPYRVHVTQNDDKISSTEKSYTFIRSTIVWWRLKQS